MNRHLVRLLLTLYPRPWRDRYGTEVVRLTQELIATGETTPTRGALNMAGAALAERFRALADSPRAAVAMAVAALLAVAGSFYASGHARPQKPPSVASAHPVVAKLTGAGWRLPVGAGARRGRPGRGHGRGRPRGDRDRDRQRYPGPDPGRRHRAGRSPSGDLPRQPEKGTVRVRRCGTAVGAWRSIVGGCTSLSFLTIPTTCSTTPRAAGRH